MRRLALWLSLALYGTGACAGVAEAERQVREQRLDAARQTLETHLATAPQDRDARFLLARVLA